MLPRKESSHPKTVLIIGASSGIGLSTLTYFALQKWKCIATYNSTKPSLAPQSGVIWHKLDVTSDTDFNLLRSAIKKHHFSIDTLVYCAGVGFYGPIECFTASDLNRQFDVNFIGFFRSIQLAIPLLKPVGGHIISIGSGASQLTTPFNGLYCSSKHALDSLSEALRYELKPFNISVSTVISGAFQTNFTTNVIWPKKWHSYHDVSAQFQKTYSDYRHRLKSAKLTKITDPKRVAKLVYRIANHHHPRFRYTIGFDSHLLLLLYKLTPRFLWEKILYTFHPVSRLEKSQVIR